MTNQETSPTMYLSDIKQGSKIIICGYRGTGKTTLANKIIDTCKLKSNTVVVSNRSDVEKYSNVSNVKIDFPETISDDTKCVILDDTCHLFKEQANKIFNDKKNDKTVIICVQSLSSIDRSTRYTCDYLFLTGTIDLIMTDRLSSFYSIKPSIVEKRFTKDQDFPTNPVIVKSDNGYVFHDIIEEQNDSQGFLSYMYNAITYPFSTV